ncbi:hypothetical protein JZM24_05655 [Candidatus Sodalis endolongispinus]|uniref:Type IV pilus biogenesis protein PilM n=1 Tax=Candidatus Sodalis endolongispinus TaxID=2812662 RepID=A0ABS5Y9X5_9GAMM|nr:hypothetical protein [Candidatus Sodalis endolongispinus]MBT9431752.1 hypothetical protein [Candidatus Sodalis endolongispinus]
MEPDVLRALALSRDLAEWRCCGWWQFPLPMARDAQGDPCPMAGTAEVLRRWRRQLPRRLSVRLCLTGLPVTLTRLPAPDRRLGETTCRWYLESQLRRRLPSLPAALAWDWCLDAAHPERVLIVSARLSALLLWRRCLRAACLPVHRLDIAAAALRRMALACGRHPALPLVHQCASGAYHVAPLAQPLDFVFSAESAAACHFTRTESGPVPEGGELWSPFDALRAASGHPSAPRERRWPRGGPADGDPVSLPDWPAAWVIAAGLALAPEERLWGR